MLFNSLHYLVFFPVTLLAYFVVPLRHRWALLLAASYYFYASWRPEYLALLVVSTVIDYGVALLMDRSADGPRRRLWLVVSLVSNLGLLGFFKYATFFADSTRTALQWAGGSPTAIPTFDILLPVGISFYTFQSLGYTIDVYRGRVKAERHLGYFALYVSFFPQLVAGPIERPDGLLPQLRADRAFDARAAADGMKLMLWGYFKKVVIADRLAAFVNVVYAEPTAYNGLVLLLATVFFSFQIYCDFSGYTDIAIGSAQVMGIRLMRNFRSPYFSRSIPEFWQRWHISLSTWFRDYVYLPLGGNRVPRWRWRMNILLTFLASGLWHGASWTFVVWGGLHGVLYVATASVSEWLGRLGLASRSLLAIPLVRGVGHLASVALTYALVCLTWVFFRAESLSDAGYILSAISADLLRPTLALAVRGDPTLEGFTHGFTRTDLFIAVAAIAVMELVHLAQLRGSLRERMQLWPVWARWSLYYAVVLCILTFGAFTTHDFIYFQF